MSRQRIFKKPSYRELIAYVALNDEPTCMDVEDMVGHASVHAINVAFGTPLEVVAKDVVNYRKRDADLQAYFKRVKAQRAADE
jgi:hypothetical protein